jgi:hypothetical protein
MPRPAAAGGRTFGAVVLAVAILVMFGIDVAAARLMPTFGIAGHDSNMTGTQARLFEIADGIFGYQIIVIDAGDGLGHGDSFLVE